MPVFRHHLAGRRMPSFFIFDCLQFTQKKVNLSVFICGTMEKHWLAEYVELEKRKHENTIPAALNFWKNIPVSKANQQVYRMFRKEAFAIYMNKYPRPKRNIHEFKVGMGTDITGPMSKQKLKLPFWWSTMSRPISRFWWRPWNTIIGSLPPPTAKERCNVSF